MRPTWAAGRPRLTGARVALVPTTRALARAVCDGEAQDVVHVLAKGGLRPAPSWPHAETAPGMLRLTLDLGSSTGAEPRGSWLVAHDGEVVGECSDHGGPDADGEVMIGYGLCPGARGQGLATEAVALLAAWAESCPGVSRLAAEVRVGNEPSLRLLRRLGFAVVGSASGTDPHLRLVRPAAGPAGPRSRHVC